MIELILLAFGTASLSHFFQKSMDEEMIFEKYHEWIKAFPTWIYKILGGCIYCNGTWIFIAVYLLHQLCVFPYNSFILALFGVLGIGVNYVFIEAIYKLK